jgi:hypothetical protein
VKVGFMSGEKKEKEERGQEGKEKKSIRTMTK